MSNESIYSGDLHQPYPPGRWLKTIRFVLRNAARLGFVVWAVMALYVTFAGVKKDTTRVTLHDIAMLGATVCACAIFTRMALSIALSPRRLARKIVLGCAAAALCYVALVGMAILGQSAMGNGKSESVFDSLFTLPASIRPRDSP